MVEPSKRGRPHGSRIDLVKDPKRFQLALYLLIRALFHIRPTAAARLAIVMLDASPRSRAAFAGIQVQGHQSFLKFDLTDGTLTSALANREDALIAKEKAISRRWWHRSMPDLDKDWLFDSIIFLAIILRPSFSKDLREVARLMLVEMGWGAILDRVCRQLEAAVLALPQGNAE